MAGLLGEIFSAGNVAKRKLTDLLGNPVLSAQQMLGNFNDRARVLNQMTAAAAKEGIAEYGPETRRLAGLLADAYNPIGLTVYHGSPAKFTKFDPTKIGSGEGAQAYGYGHYVAQSPGVAKEYSKANQGRSAAAEGLIDELPKRMQMEVFKVMQMPDGNFKEVAKQDLIKKYPESASVLGSKQGNFYEIDLPDEQIARMLDFDKPLMQQSKEIQALAKQYGLTDPDHLGGDLIAAMDAKRAAGAELMRQAGVPGIRYLDQGSRGRGEGTSNFVVFPGGEDLLTILKRNGGLLGP